MPPDVDLVPLRPPILEALLAGDLARASDAAGHALPPEFLDDERLWRLRLGQVREDAAMEPWLPRAIVDRPSGAVVGHAGFHGPPNAAAMVEVGYVVLPEHRRRGYARATLAELITFAAANGARTIRASIAPDNEPSRALAEGQGFRHVGEQWDEEDGLELVFERPLG
jgi:[ribosomal protein S5]-alanine N-acetyltransferase